MTPRTITLGAHRALIQYVKHRMGCAKCGRIETRSKTKRQSIRRCPEGRRLVLAADTLSQGVRP